MTDTRVTRTSAEILARRLGINTRVSQVSVETLVYPSERNILVSQVSIECMVKVAGGRQFGPALQMN